MVEQRVRGVEGISAMIRQILIEYPGLPDYRTLSLHEIKFFYEPLIPDLLKRGKQE